MVIVSLTTTPPNFYHVAKYASKLLNSQTIQPDLIVINVPAEYNRDVFCVDGMKIGIESNDERIIVNRCSDVGPATKILGIFESDIYESIKDTDSIVVIDDDIIYPEAMIEEYVSVLEMVKNSENIMFGVTGCNLEEGYTEQLEIENSHLQAVNMVQGWSSYCISGKILNHLKNAVSIHCYPSHTFYQDDIFLSNFVKEKFDIRMVQTKRLWAHRFGENGMIQNDKLRINQNIGDGSLQMHNDRSILGGSGDDGNLKKNILSIAFLIRKGLLNFDITDQRKKDVLIHEHCLKSFGEIDESMCLILTSKVENLSVIDTITFLDKKAKAVSCTKAVASRIGMSIGRIGLEEYSSVYENRGIDVLIETMVAEANFLTGRKTGPKKVAVVFHVVVDGGHGCYTRVTETLKNIGSTCEVDFYTKTVNEKGLDKQNEILSTCGISKLDVFKSESVEGTLCEDWSKYLKEKVNTNEYDLVLVYYEHLVSEEFIDSLDPRRVIIDTSDDIFLNEKIQEFMSDTDLEPLNYSRHVYRNKRKNQKKFDKDITRWFISSEEFDTRGSKIDCFIPHVTIPNGGKIPVSDSDDSLTFLSNPVIVSSDNVFNVDSMKRLDEVASFDIDVYGKICDVYTPKNKHLKMKGYVEDLKEIYSEAPFSINPVVMGTGSKIKIQESLGWGVPVVSMVDNALNSDLIDGYNGYICNSYEELIKTCIDLKRDILRIKIFNRNARMNQEESYVSNLGVYEYMKIYWGTHV